MNRLDGMLAALSSVYADAAALTDRGTSHVVVDGHAVVSRHAVAGVGVRVEERMDNVSVELLVAKEARIENPIHTCIGFLQPRGTQQVNIRLRLEPRSSATILAHCLFPNAEIGSHAMNAGVELEEGSELHYLERHYHGIAGGMVVWPKVDVRVNSGARYFSDFSLTEGPVGRLELCQRVQTAEDAVAEITARISGRAKDEIRIRDELVLAGKSSRGLIRTRIALAGDARGEVIGITRGQAEAARGHMDCMELVRDRAVARAEPIVDVSHPLAKVTHEAAVGTVDQDQLETLMAHGLSPEEAVDVIVKGILK